MNQPKEGRTPLNTDRVLAAAVALADSNGLETLSMRSLADTLGVVPMALYKHVRHKDELVERMIDLVVAEIEPPIPGLAWKPALRARILSARQALLRHKWARAAMEGRSTPSMVVLTYMDSMIAMFLAGGFSVDLTHHCMHALGSRLFGFSQELYTGGQQSTPDAETARQMALVFPNIFAVATSSLHDHDSVIGAGCDDQFEFEFALDLVLDGFDLLHQRHWRSKDRQTGLGKVG